MSICRLNETFFKKDVLEVAPALLGKKLIVVKNNLKSEYFITETEAYRGEEDLACHASKGMTPRNKIMYAEGGFIYVYLVYGMYWMLNFVTGAENIPQAVLIRGVTDNNGPGKLTRRLGIDKSFHGENLFESSRIWVEPGMEQINFVTASRVGIDYAGDYWKNIKWRYILSNV